MALKTIPQLDEATSFSENAVFPIDSGTESFKVKASNVAKSLAPLLPTDSAIYKWSATQTYLANDMVYYGEDLYISLQGSNTNHAVTESTWWKRITKRGINPQLSPELALRAINTWEEQSIAPSGEFIGADIVWAEDFNRFIMAGDGGASPGDHNRSFFVSSNGKTWDEKSNGSFQAVGIIYAPEFKRVIAVGYGIATTCCVSDDGGDNWSNKTTPSNMYCGPIGFSPEQGRLVALSIDDAAEKSGMYSDDGGDTWTDFEGMAQDENWADICWSQYLKRWTAVAFTGTHMQKSSTGYSGWSTVSLPGSPSVKSVCSAEDLEIMVAVGDGYAAWSTNGDNWTQVSIPSGDYRRVRRAPELGVFIAVGASKIAYSYDGKTWTAVTPVASSWLGLAWSPQLGIFAAASYGTFGTDPVMTSRFVKKLIAP